MGLNGKKNELNSTLKNRSLSDMSEEILKKEVKFEESVNDFFDNIVNNLNVLKSFSMDFDKRLTEMEEKMEKMNEPLNELKKIMLE